MADEEEGRRAEDSSLSGCTVSRVYEDSLGRELRGFMDGRRQGRARIIIKLNA